MKNRFQIKSFVIAAIFLAVYLHVFITQASCNLSHLFEQTQSSHNHPNGHDHHHGNEEVPPYDHVDKPDHQHDGKSEKDDSCCSEKTSTFFASQSNPSTFSVDFKNSVNADLIFICALIAFNPAAYNTRGYVSYTLPPPKIPDIRVFIQSFII